MSRAKSLAKDLVPVVPMTFELKFPDELNISPIIINSKKSEIMKFKEFLKWKKKQPMDISGILKKASEKTVNRPYLPQDDIQALWTKIVYESNNK